MKLHKRVLFSCLFLYLLVLLTFQRRRPVQVVVQLNQSRQFQRRIPVQVVVQLNQSRQVSHSTAFIQLCVMSVSRGNVSYVNDVLGSLQAAMNSSWNMAVQVLDLSPEVERQDMQVAQQRFDGFSFEKVQNRSRLNCPAGCVEAVEGSIPCCVQQQTLDVATGLQLCARDTHPNGWVVYLEDDSVACPEALEHMQLALSLLSPGKWHAATFSSFFTGVAFHRSSIDAFAQQVSKEVQNMPIDHLFGTPWSSKATYAYTGNLFRHRGHTSSFSYRNEQWFRDLYDNPWRFASSLTECSVMDTEELLRSLLPVTRL